MFSTKNKFFLAVLALASLLLIWHGTGYLIEAQCAQHRAAEQCHYSYYPLMFSMTRAEKHHDLLLVVATFLLVVATFLLAMVVIFQIRDARLSSERQLRAYVFVQKTNVKDDNERKKWVISFRIRNFGQTPAHYVRLKYAVKAVDWKTPKLPNPEEVEDLGSMGPRKLSFEMDDELPFKDATLEEFKYQTKAIYLLGTITYETVFGKSYYTNFRYYVGGDIPWEAGEMNADEEGNDAT